MRIKDIEIEGFKSIKDQHLTPSDFTVLIGKNNSGKSNVIAALATFKEFFDKDTPGDAWFKSNHYKGDSHQISLAFHFILNDHEWLELLRNSVDEDLASECKENGGLREIRAYRNFSEEGVNNDILVNYKENWQNAFDLEGEERFRHYFANEVKRIMTESVNSWEFIDPVRDPRFRMKPARVEKMSASGEDLIRALETLRSSPRRDIFDKIAEDYVDIMENVLDVRIEYDFDDPQTDQFTVVVEEAGFEKRFKASEISSGSLEILVLLTKIYSAAQTSDLLAIEEPELHLHPGAEKKVFDIISDLVDDSDLQVLASTHSEVFVDESRVGNIVSVTRSKDTRLKTIDIDELEHLEILGYDQSDLFQSDAVTVVEGRSDKIILEQVAEKIGCDLSENGVEIIVGKGDQIKRDAEVITKVLGQLGIPYLFVFDSDGRNPDEKQEELGDALGITDENLYILNEYAIESYLLSSPEAIASAINEDIVEIEEYIDANWKGGEPAGILDDLFRSYLGTSYNKESHGAQIVKHLDSKDVDPELGKLIQKISKL